MPTVVVTEFLRGFAPHDVASAFSVLRFFETENLDEATARRAAELAWAVRGLRDIRPSIADLVVVAHAERHGVVVTANDPDIKALADASGKIGVVDFGDL